MELIYDLDQNSGAMPIRWCLNQDEQTQIIEKSLLNLYVVIDLFYGRQDTDSYLESNTRERIIAPIDQYMQYISFRRPGLAHVCVAVVVSSRNTEKGVAEMFSKLNMLRDDGSFAGRLFAFEEASDGHTKEQSLTLASNHQHECECRVISHKHLAIEVPEEYFGKPFTGWKKWWVEWVPRELLRRKLIDQCDQRRWAVFAFTAQFLVFPIVMGVRSFFAVIFYFINFCFASYYVLWRGYRGIDFEDFWRLGTNPGQMRVDAKHHGYSSIYDETKEREPHSLWHRLVQPAFITLVLGVWWTISVTQTTGHLSRLGVMAVIVGLLGWIPSFVDWVRSFSQTYRSNRSESECERDRRLKLEKKAAEAALQQASAERVKILVSDLACPVVPVAAIDDPRRFLSVDALPAERRTLQLRFDEVKARWCKPLAR